jgi:hypothetical protein
MRKAIILTGVAAAALILAIGGKVISRKTPGGNYESSSSARPYGGGPTKISEKIAAPFHAEWSPALAELALLSNDPRRGKEIANLVAGISESNLLQAIGFFRKSQPADLAAEISSGLLRRLAAGDPAAAAANAESLPDGAERLRALNDVAVVWSNLDLANATKWVDTWSNPEERTAGIITLGYEAARTESVTALNLAVDLPPSTDRDALIDHAVAQWAVNQPEQAVGWARQISDLALRDGALARIAVEWATKDPAAAATVAVTELPAGNLQNDTVVGIVQRWTQLDPDAAGRWVNEFPEGRIKETALKNISALRQP